jgi:hypothetical protein
LIDAEILLAVKTTVMALLYVGWLFKCSIQATRSQARSLNQTDSTGKPTSDVIQNLGAAVRKLEDIFVRVAVEEASRQRISPNWTTEEESGTYAVIVAPSGNLSGLTLKISNTI